MPPNAFSICLMQAFLLSPVTEGVRLALRKDKPEHLNTYTRQSHFSIFPFPRSYHKMGEETL